MSYTVKATCREGKQCGLGILGGSEVKNLPANAGDTDSIPGSGRSPGEGNGNPLQSSCPGNPQRSLVGCSPWSCKSLGHDLGTKKQQQCGAGSRPVSGLGYCQAQAEKN